MAFYDYTRFRPWVKEELTLRESNTNSVDEEFRKPLATWMRFTSFGSTDNGDGFIMDGGRTFDDSYGFNDLNQTILGKTITGGQHYLKNDTNIKHRPPPGVVNINCDMNGSSEGKFWICKIQWRCWSVDQLNYISPYFMNPGLSCLIEWGWNNCPQPPLSLVDYSKLVSFWDDYKVISDRWEACKGRSGFIIGIISNFEFTLNENGGFDCTTEVKCTGELAKHLQSTESSATDAEGKVKFDLASWLDKYLDKLADDNGEPIDGLSKEKYTVKKVIDGKLIDVEMPSPYDQSVEWKKQVFTFKNFKENEERSMEDDEAADSSEGEMYIRFNVVIDIINAFYRDKDNPDAKLKAFSLDTDGIRITANPNLKSTSDGLLIPNERAPVGYSYNFVVDGKYVGFYGDAESNFKEANDICASNGVGVFSDTDQTTPWRVDLLSIIKKGLSKNSNVDSFKSFPSYGYFDPNEYDVGDTSPADDYGYFGYLNDLFVNKEVVKKCLTSNQNMMDGLLQLLNDMSGMACNIWQFSIVPYFDNTNNMMTIIDKSYKGKRSIDKFISEEGTSESSYTFKFGKYKSIVKSAAFTGKMSDAVANQVLYNNPRGKQKALHAPKDWTSLFQVKDLLSTFRESQAATKNDQNKTGVDESKADPKSVNASDLKWKPLKVKDKRTGEIKLSTSQLSDTGEIITTQTNSTKGDIVVRLIESDSGLQSNLLKDDHPQNNSVRNVPIPGVELELTILGITGLKTNDVFYFDGLPDFFVKNAILYIKNMTHDVSEAGWYTSIKAAISVGPAKVTES